jgi:hypothetical protein
MNFIERLECVYYPGPVPPDSAVLTILCLVFDKIFFPGVYLPKGDYDKASLHQEIKRLEGLEPSFGSSELIGLLKFLEYRLPLDGILEYPSERDSIFKASHDEESGKPVRAIYDAHYPPRENFEPMFTGASVKGLPQSKESVVCLGDFHYQANAINYAARNHLPLLDDGSRYALPFNAPYKDNAPSLAALLAIQSASLILPDLPVMTAQELVDFRMENVNELRNFRASMLRYAKNLNATISEGVPIEEVNRKAKLVVDTEISPTLYELNRDLCNPNRPWYKRMIEGAKIVSSVAAGIFSGGLVGQTAAVGIGNAILSEFDGRGDKLEAARRNGLYYLLKAKTIKG